MTQQFCRRCNGQLFVERGGEDGDEAVCLQCGDRQPLASVQAPVALGPFDALKLATERAIEKLRQQVEQQRAAADRTALQLGRVEMAYRVLCEPGMQLVRKQTAPTDGARAKNGRRGRGPKLPVAAADGA